MRVIDFISVIKESAQVEVVDNMTDEVLAEYNGKDDIDPAYNDCVITGIDIPEDGVANLFVSYERNF